MDLSVRNIENKIHTIRGVQVILDSDLAAMYQVETRVLNQATRRNIDRFPESFRFQLTEHEFLDLRSQSVISKPIHGGRRYLPFVFTEQGVAMLSAVLNTEVAIKVSVEIMQAFVSMRRTLIGLHGVIQRLESVEIKQLQSDSKLEQVLKALEKDTTPRQGIFFEGQLFDAHVFASDLIRQAQVSIILVDNYVNESTLLLLSKRRTKVKCEIRTRLNAALQKDLEKHNRQYNPISIFENRSSHDRFMIIDYQSLYHIGASLKDLGNKCFAFSRMDQFLDDVKTKLLNR
jgi:hypothetical protein